MYNFIRDVREPYNAAREIALRRWPGAPQFEDLQLDWMRVLEAITVEEADRVIQELEKTNQQFWNWFAEYIKPRIAELQRNVRAIDAPPLYRPVPIEGNEYFYANTDVPLVGRKEEQALLLEFLESDQAVAWMLMVGGAGSGKSRLGLWAMEKAEGLGYEAGFLNKGTTFEHWDRWIVHQDTFIIVDYALRRSGNLTNALDGLIGTCKGHKLRILVLERNPIGPWMSQLQDVPWRFGPTPVETRSPIPNSYNTADPQRTSSNAVSNIPPIAQPTGEITGKTSGPVGGPHINLDSMNREGSTELLTLLTKDAELPPAWTIERLADALEHADPTRRPLFARFLVDAIIANKYRSDWMAQDLARYVLYNDISKRWKPRNIDYLHANLSTVACALKGVDVNWLDKIQCLDGLVPRRSTRTDDACQTISSLGGGYRDLQIPSHEPDTLAELYILERLTGRIEAHNDESAEQDTSNILACLWHSQEQALSASFDIHSMLLDLMGRLANNFRNHPGLPTALAVPDDLPSNATDVVHSIIYALDFAAVDSDIDIQDTNLPSLTENDSAAKSSARGATFRAQALFAATYGREITPDGQNALARLRVLASKHRGDSLVQYELAKALFNLNNDRETTPAGEAALEELRDLASIHSADDNIRFLLAQAHTNATWKLLSVEERRARLQELKVLSDEYPHDETIRALYAMAITNCVAREHSFTAKLRLIDQLDNLQTMWPEEMPILIELGKALFNAAYGIESTDSGLSLLSRLRSLAFKNPGCGDLVLTHAMFLNNAIGKEKRVEERQKLLQELKLLAANSPSSDSIVSQLASGLYNATFGRELSRESRRALAALRKLSRWHPDQASIRRFLAMALNNKVFEVLGDTERGELLVELRILHSSYPLEEELLTQYATALSNGVLRARDPALKARWLDDLARLASSFPENSKLNEIRRVAGNNF